MKKLALLLSLVLALALAAPAFAVEADVSGELRFDTWFAKDDNEDYTLRGEAESSVDLTVETGMATKVAIGWDIGAGDALIGESALSGGIDLELDHAYIETTGAFLKGSPAVVSRLGHFETNLHDWVADFGSQDSILVNQINLGMGSLGLYHGWAGEMHDDASGNPTIAFPDDEVAAISGSASIDVLDLSGTVVKKGFDDTYDFAVGASAMPAEGVSVGFDYAVDGTGDMVNEASGWAVNGKLATLPGLTLTADVWSTEEYFSPFYHAINTDDDEPSAFKTNGNTAYQFVKGEDTNDNQYGSKGFKIGGKTNQAGLDISASFESEASQDETTVDKDTIKFGIGRTVSGIGLTYDLKIESGTTEDTTHEFGASTTIDTPVADGVKLSGVAKLKESTDYDSEIRTSAEWTAPNGLDLGLHWVNYNYNEDGDFDINGANEDGFYVTAGMTVEF